MQIERNYIFLSNVTILCIVVDKPYTLVNIYDIKKYLLVVWNIQSYTPGTNIKYPYDIHNIIIIKVDINSCYSIH